MGGGRVEFENWKVNYYTSFSQEPPNTHTKKKIKMKAWRNKALDWTLFPHSEGNKAVFSEDKILEQYQGKLFLCRLLPITPTSTSSRIAPCAPPLQPWYSCVGNQMGGARMNDFNKPYNFYFPKYWRSFSSLQLHKRAFQLSLKG